MRYTHCNNQEHTMLFEMHLNRNNFVIVDCSQGRGTPFAFWGGVRVLRVLQSIEICQIIIIIIFVCTACIRYGTCTVFRRDILVREV